MIEEVFVNLVGSEEMAVFEVEQEQKRLALVASFGVDKAAYQEIPLGAGVNGRVAESGQPFFAGTNRASGYGGEERLTACIPLRVDGQVRGAIAIHRPGPIRTGKRAWKRRP